MKIKSKVIGLVVATSLFAAAGASQADCGTCRIQPGFQGVGWHLVPCSANIGPALTWDQYVSGGYTAPVAGVRHGYGRSGFFFWPW